MKLKDLQIVDKKPPPDKESTRSRKLQNTWTNLLVLNRVQCFLETAKTSDPPTDFETPDEDKQHIELVSQYRYG